MADFWQHGSITVLQRLKNRPVADLEAEIEKIAKRRKIVLLLPALYSEFQTPSMPRIIEELKQVRYLHKVVLSLDKANLSEFALIRIALAPHSRVFTSYRIFLERHPTHPIFLKVFHSQFLFPCQFELGKGA